MTQVDPLGFNFAGTGSRIVEHELIECSIGDRVLPVEFVVAPEGVTVRETYDSEPTHSREQHRPGWQAILNNFAKYVTVKQIG